MKFCLDYLLAIAPHEHTPPHDGTFWAPAILAALALTAAFALVKWQNKRGRIIVRAWAQTHGFRLLTCRKVSSFFLSRYGPGEMIYEVSVHLPDGQQQWARLRIGSFIFSGKVWVDWINEPSLMSGPPGFPVILKPGACGEVKKVIWQRGFAVVMAKQDKPR